MLLALTTPLLHCLYPVLCFPIAMLADACNIDGVHRHVVFLFFLQHNTGTVCISILHAPGDDPNGYEQASERWSPVQSVEKILLSVISMLAEPNDESGANVDASKMWREDRARFLKITEQVRSWWPTSTSTSAYSASIPCAYRLHQ